MATSFSVNLGFHQPISPLELSDSNSNNRLQAKCTTPKTQTRELVDRLRYYVKKRLLQEMKTVHGHVLKSDFGEDDFLLSLNHVANAYWKLSDFKAAREVFDKMPRRNVFSWMVMILGSIENGLYHDGFKYFCDMLDSGEWPNVFTYTAILKLCIGLDSVEFGKMVHAHIVIRGFASNVFVSTSLLTMYMKSGEVEDSCQVFNTMTEHNAVSWNAVISGFTSRGHYEEAFNFFLSMKEEGFPPDGYTFSSVLKAVGQLRDSDKGKEIHMCISELGMESNVRMGTALIDMYSKCGVLSDARSVFLSNFTNCKLNMPWNAMISGYSQWGCSKEALELFVKMHENEVKSDVYTWCSVFNALADLKDLKFAREAHGMVLKSGYELVLEVRNAIADAYSKCGSLEDLRKIFDRAKERDVVSWATMLTAYSQCFQWEEVLAIICKMRKEGFTPDHLTFSTAFAACASLCFLEFGRQVHGLLFKSGLDTDKSVVSALIDMYAKCGNTTEAQKVFRRISKPDNVSWTAIISAHAQRGNVGRALRIFKTMEKLGINPTGSTLLCVLFACSHGGMVEEGLHYFQQMEETYGVAPEIEHYACIIDLLGRVGLLNEAMEFIQKMPIEPTNTVWQTLLEACRVHGNVELGEIAAKNILSIQPEYSSPYGLLSNTYMGEGSFRGGISMRNLMEQRGVQQEPGWSWISVNGEVHKFYLGDHERHPQKDQINLVLEVLRKKIEEIAYATDRRNLLLDGDFVRESGF